LASAPDLGSGSHGFESHRPDSGIPIPRLPFLSGHFPQRRNTWPAHGKPSGLFPGTASGREGCPVACGFGFAPSHSGDTERAMPRIRDREKQRAYERAWYAKNRETVMQKVKARKEAVATWFKAYKATLKCSRCGEDDPITLDFHHREQVGRKARLVWAWKRGWGIARLQRELAKCDVLCANCHRKLHRDLRQFHAEGRS
jgi:hypothetical protein